MDGKPDALLDDCPYEMGCRDALFLSSKAKPGEYLRKVCEQGIQNQPVTARLPFQNAIPALS